MYIHTCQVVRVHAVYRAITCAVNINTSEWCHRMFWTLFLLAASSCCCQKMYWNESLSAEPSDDVIFLKSWASLSNVTPLDSDATAIFFLSLSSCFDTKRYWWCSWLIRLIRVGIGWYLNNDWYNVLQSYYDLIIHIPVIDVIRGSGAIKTSALHTNSLDRKSSTENRAGQAANSWTATGKQQLAVFVPNCSTSWQRQVIQKSSLRTCYA